ncbi:hypothetical protein [uncultured Stenotrophomonas sp.]|uniref:hypothetical protein n=1 Tax=uncultured Stenotrophomonas sp. TaxID=165438 RepID=UPI0025ED4EBA|nr:hypothetical protein [uncultured Stenotrophomonas sp.]
MQKRCLRLLAGGVGTGFRRRALAPVSLYLLLAVVVLITAWLGQSYWPQLAPLVLLLCAGLLGWVRRVRQRWLGVYLAAVVLLLVLQSTWSGLTAAGVERVALVAMALGLAQLLIHSSRVWRFSRALQLQVDGLDDAAILAVLPPEAAEEARQWLGGDDRKAAELSEVVSLSVLYAVLQAPGTQRRHLRRILMG